MPTTRETILATLHTRLQTLAASVLRGDVLPERIPATGLIILRGAVKRMRTSLCYPNPAAVSGRQKAAPLSESGGAGRLVGVAVLEMAFRRKVVVHRGMD